MQVYFWQKSFDVIYSWNRFYHTILGSYLDIAIVCPCLFEILFVYMYVYMLHNIFLIFFCHN